MPVQFGCLFWYFSAGSGSFVLHQTCNPHFVVLPWYCHCRTSNWHSLQVAAAERISTEFKSLAVAKYILMVLYCRCRNINWHLSCRCRAYFKHILTVITNAAAVDTNILVCDMSLPCIFLFLFMYLPLPGTIQVNLM
jgi:hypothetical protein